ncbi:endocuticle structural glycoprotein ABD-4-like [Toxorhynchites rutilus septentrionalis]|uniref:endocuticle structural glycoprotein ABD-4-like n=1 Tax=Toxorhynchites rutilus septentrionalis TaxID=329112 RepID=UPI0024794886|nr:endocuticle structural glycoprotein ABD-4-like [Toxorhynchites rutilus septentrionalis]
MFKLVVISALVALAVAQDPKDTQAQIVAQDAIINPDGSYQNRFETSNGINAQESGVGAQSAKGSYSFTGTDGAQYTVEYVADENGYQPRGAHLPAEQPAPEYVLKGLEQIRSNPPRDDPNFNLDALNAAIARLSGKK